jgi:HAD superfamily hydrolase (TIGR01549 family)
MHRILNEIRREINTGRLQASLFPQEKRAIIKNYQLILEKLGHADRSYEFAYDLYSGYANLPHYLFDDVLPTFSKLQQAGLKLGILSNHSRSARPVMDGMVGSYISAAHITISEDISTHKPENTIFWLAAAKLNEPVTNCLYVGDNLEVDAIGAVQEGGYARGLWLNRQKRPFASQLPQNVYQIQSLTEVIDFLP